MALSLIFKGSLSEIISLVKGVLSKRDIKKPPKGAMRRFRCVLSDLGSPDELHVGNRLTLRDLSGAWRGL